MTVPWNVFAVKLPYESPDNFPEIDNISDEFVCKRTHARIEGALGYFFGSVSRVTDLAEGNGVFMSGAIIDCGKVKNGFFADGRRVSVDSDSKILKLVNTKYPADGTVLQKVERYSKQGVERNFLKDG